MSYPAIFAVLVLLVGGCQKKSKDTKEQAKASPPATQKKSMGAAAPLLEKKAEDPALVAERAKLAADLLEREAAAFSPSEKSIVWADAYHVEGYGTKTLYRRKVGQDAETIVEIETGDEKQAPQEAAAARTLNAMFKKDGYLRLSKTNWEYGEESLSVESIERVFHWKKGALSIAVSGQGPMKLESYEPLDPHEPIPTAVFATAGTGVVVVEITYDPGDKYHEGYTINRQMDVFAYRELELAREGPM